MCRRCTDAHQGSCMIGIEAIANPDLMVADANKIR